MNFLDLTLFSAQTSIHTTLKLQMRFSENLKEVVIRRYGVLSNKTSFGGTAP